MLCLVFGINGLVPWLEHCHSLGQFLEYHSLSLLPQEGTQEDQSKLPVKQLLNGNYVVHMRRGRAVRKWVSSGSRNTERAIWGEEKKRGKEEKRSFLDSQQ